MRVRRRCSHNSAVGPPTAAPADQAGLSRRQGRYQRHQWLGWADRHQHWRWRHSNELIGIRTQRDLRDLVQRNLSSRGAMRLCGARREC